MLSRKKRVAVNLFLVKPSNYDDDGYVVRYFRGVLPSNTLACLAGLTEKASSEGPLAEYDFRVHLVDETVTKVNVRRIARTQARNTKTIVCLAGIQTSQFPRAADLAKAFRAAGITVLMGGFHVSGYLKMIGCIPAEIQELMDLGVCIVKGEVEQEWPGLLEKAVTGKLEPLYDFLSRPPDLTAAPIPLADRRYLKRFVLSGSGTIDCGRGCPYKCTFCTIINVQGRKMRFRSPEAIRDALRQNWIRKRIGFYFFTDDNFARNRNWEKIFDLIIELREKERVPITFMMQVDALSYRIPDFVAKAERAGCSNVFIGMESLNPRNLQAAGKSQNQVGDFRNLTDAYRAAGISVHVGYILGFPYDTPDSVRADVERLMKEVQIDMVSFFILTPLPGSADHARFLEDGRYMDPDFNRYDSFHETMDYPGFPEKGTLRALYEEVWQTFYSFESMSRILNRCSQTQYWNLFRNFFWYRASLLEKRHPMTAGFLRMKGRRRVRPSVEPLDRLAYMKVRFAEVKENILGLLALLLEMQVLWVQTRKHSELEKRIVAELNQLRLKRVRLRDLQMAYSRVSSRLPSLQVPSSARLFLQKWSPFSLSQHFYRREEVIGFWERTVADLRRGHPAPLFRSALLKRLWLDSKLTFHFMRACVSQATRGRLAGLD